MKNTKDEMSCYAIQYDKKCFVGFVDDGAHCAHK